MKPGLFPTAFLILLTAAPCLAQRQVQPLDAGWKFLKQDAAPDADTSSWSAVSLPHTWNALDAQGSAPDTAVPAGNATGAPRRSYYRGPGWYERTLDIPAAWQGRRVFIRFEAASQVADVFVNGQAVGEHRGAFTAFCFELTPFLKFGQPNELRLRVDNSLVDTIAPLSGDFNVDGGIYRPAELLVTVPVCITPLDDASPGVYLTTKSVGAPPTSDSPGTPALVEIKTLLSNGGASAAPVFVEMEIRDAAGQTVAAGNAFATVAPGATAQPVTLTLPVPNPHLWNGVKDPYLYSVAVRVRRPVNGLVSDAVGQPLGLRTVQITDADGFLLNGRPYPIHGVNRHQEVRDEGWALSPADHERDVRLMLDMGVTAVRLSHYPQSEYIFDLADRTGLLLWDEEPFVNLVARQPGDVTDFTANLEQQMREMILQRYNHPSAVFWSLYNELNTGRNDAAALPITQKSNTLAHALDPMTITVAASNHPENSTNAVPDRVAFNTYPGWYGRETGDAIGQSMKKFIDDRFAQMRERVAVSEYGAGGNPEQHAETLSHPTANRGPFHPEEWQCYVHEQDYAQIKNNPKLWGSFLWCMFDFASFGRNEGGKPSTNDKGMVTADRQTKKDVYYFYQANWSDTPMVFLVSKGLTARTLPQTEVKVYSNCPEVELFVNGQSLGQVQPDNIRIARWPNVTLQPGRNTIVAIAHADGKEIRDATEWNLSPPADTKPNTTPAPAAAAATSVTPTSSTPTAPAAPPASSATPAPPTP